MKQIRLFAFLLLVFFIPLTHTSAQETYTFTMPDVRDDFCGVEINYQYCKCAFHNDYCNAIDSTDSDARRYVMGQFRTWVGDMIESMAQSCLDDGNHWSAGLRTCTVKEKPSESNTTDAPLEEQYSLPPMAGVPEPKKTGYFGKVSQADGEAFVYQWAFQRWVRAHPGMPIYQGDFIKTLNGDTRIIYNGEFGDDVLNLAPETTLGTGRTVEEVPREDNVSVLGIIQEGAVEIYNDIHGAYEQDTPVPQWYRQLHTPNVAPGIRGSHVVITYDPDTNKTSIFVNEGMVEVSPKDTSSPVILVPGEQAIASDTMFATSSVETWSSVTDMYNLPAERVDATAAEREHTAPSTPVDDQPTDTRPTREELVGDLSDIEKQFETGPQWGLWTLILVVSGVSFWFYRRKK